MGDGDCIWGIRGDNNVQVKDGGTLTVLYVKRVVIRNNEIAEFEMSLGQKIKALFGIGPNYKQLLARTTDYFQKTGLLGPSRDEPLKLEKAKDERWDC